MTQFLLMAKEKVNLFSNGEKENFFEIVYWPLRTLYFFSVFIINISSFVFLSQGNVCQCHTFHYYTHIRYFSFCVSSLHGFLLYPETVFVVFFCLLFLSSNLNLFNLFWFFIHVLNDLIFLLFFCFSIIKSQFFFFLLLFALCLYSSVRITHNYMYY